MTQQDLLKKLIDLLYAYSSEEEGSSLSLTNFSAYLNAQVGGEQPTDTAEYQYTTQSDELGISLVLLQRYAKAYVKKALADTSLSTGDEFSFLMMLFVAGNHTKTELINKMLLSKTSGIEVLKRLRKSGFIREYDDQEDKRSKRVAITPSGKQVVHHLLPRITGVSKLISGDLSESELRTLNFLLKKLEIYHKAHFDLIYNEQLEQLISEKEV